MSGSVGIIGGTGPLGAGLASRFARGGRTVYIGSRDAARAEAVVTDMGIDGLIGTDNRSAADADTVVVAVPAAGVADIVGPLAAQLAGKSVISCVNGMAVGRGGPSPVYPDGHASWAQLIAELAPDAAVATAFNHAPAKPLSGDHALEGDVMICADDDVAAEAAADLVRAVADLRAVHVGGLALAGTVEAMTAVLVSTNMRHKVHAGLRLTGL